MDKKFKANKGHYRDEFKEQEEAELKLEIQLHTDDYTKIKEEIDNIKYIDMNEKTHELIVDLLNLIFGKSEETEQFWEFYLIDECKSYFKIQEAMRDHQY